MANILSQTQTFGYNMGLEFMAAQQKVSALKDAEKGNLVQKLQEYNAKLKDLSELMSALSERKPHGRAHYQDDPAFSELIDRVREAHRNPETGKSIIPDCKYNWDSEKEIETTLQVIGDYVKILGQEWNVVTMEMQQTVQDTNQITDIARKVLDMISRHIESIISKSRHQ